MDIKVRVFGDLKSVLGKGLTLNVKEGATVRSLIHRLADKTDLKPEGLIGKYRKDGGDLAILLNGRNIRLLGGLDTGLKDDDEVIFLPPAPGG